MKPDLARLTVTLPATQKQQLQQWCDANRLPASYLIRRLIDQHFGNAPASP